jgi:predicted PhzF superfamily epimerase YddE/YHI9
MTVVHMLRVFVDGEGEFGDIAPVVIDEGRKISDAERQALAVKLGAPETVFVNDIANANISIMHLQGEVDFAGTPALGVAWLLTKLARKPITMIKGRGGSIVISQEAGLTWVRADLATMPPWRHKQLNSAEEVECLTLQQTKSWAHTMAWAWIDETRHLIRARTFAADWDIPEAQGNGSGSMMLASMIHKPIELKHGDGSVIFARPTPNKCADIGGRIIEESNISV